MRVFPVALRLLVVEQVLKRGASVSEVARTFGVSVSSIETWCTKFEQGGVEALVPKPVELLPSGCSASGRDECF